MRVRDRCERKPGEGPAQERVRGAMDYTLSNWAALSVYVDDGWLDIDNNEGENSLRGIALGRKNWLFCGSDRGGRAAAVHFTLLACCKRHGHDPWVYYLLVYLALARSRKRPPLSKFAPPYASSRNRGPSHSTRTAAETASSAGTPYCPPVDGS